MKPVIKKQPELLVDSHHDLKIGDIIPDEKMFPMGEKIARKPDPLTYFFSHNEHINGVNYISKDDFLNYFK